MKSLFLYLLLVLGLSTLPFISIYSTSFLPHTSDGGVQIPRMASYYRGTLEGNFPIRWAGSINYGYGMPLFIFIYHTPFWVANVFLSLGENLIQTFKHVLLLSYLLSGLGMFLYALHLTHNPRAASFVALLYQFAPFHLIEVLTRGAIGTVYIYALVPFLFLLLSMFKMPSLPSTKYLQPVIIISQQFMLVSLIGLVTMVLIVSHNSMALVFFLLAGIYGLFYYPTWPLRIASWAALGTGLLISMWYWLPALVEHRFTYGNLFMQQIYLEHFPSLWSYLIPNPFHISSLRTAEINTNWGIVQSIGIIFAGIVLIRRPRLSNKTYQVLLFCVVATILATTMTQPLSIPLWKQSNLLQQFQFPWRFLAVIVFTTSVGAISLVRSRIFKSSTGFIMLVFLLIIPTIFLWRPTEGYDYFTNDNYFWRYPLNTTYFGETDVIWSAGPAWRYPENRIHAIAGSVEVYRFSKNNRNISAMINASIDSQVVAHIQYFPGWQVFLDGKKQPIQFQDPNWRGMITFAVPAGEHQLYITFSESKTRALANAISLISGSCILFFLGCRQFIRYFRQSRVTT